MRPGIFMIGIILCPIVFSQGIEQNIYLPKNGQAKSLGIKYIRINGLFIYPNEPERKGNRNKEEFFYNLNGNLDYILNYSRASDTLASTMTSYSYDDHDSIIESKTFNLLDSLITHEILYFYEYEGKQLKYWKYNAVKRFWDGDSNNYQKESWIYYNNELIKRDSFKLVFNNIKPRIWSSDYYYNANDLCTQITTCRYLNGQISKSYTFKYYDEQNRLIKSKIKNGAFSKRNVKWIYNDAKNTIEIKSKYDNMRYVYYKFNENKQLIEYIPDKKSNILREYKFSYNELGLIDTLYTIAPKDDWIQIKVFEYEFYQ